MTTELDHLKTVMALIRDNRFNDAWEFLDTMLVSDPEQVAQWYLFSKFIARGNASFGKEVRGALGEVSRVATHAFDVILRELESHVPDTVAIDHAKDSAIARLDGFLKAIRQSRDGAARVHPEGSDQGVEPLMRFLERMQQAKLAQMDPVRRIEQRLDGLRRRMKDRSVTPHPSVRHRLAERLTSFGGSLDGTKKGRRHVG
ncbi:MAG: hypothetical protein HQL89_17530 [Magnetococcales bacterium]|nr:hypothetical protein [Magnetococcales bacterium]